MNPPSAIQGAMSRDRKPFTYTPGGLDLSEIKSERMAKRLMRNAMNEGVPELPRQQIQSPPTTTIAVPNFNCLPVQVFPAFNLPANPKSLLRTRSNPVAREPPFQREPPPPQFVNNKANDAAQFDTFSKNTAPCSQINNNRPSSMYEYGATGNTHAFMNYGNGNNECNAAFPEISYDAQYFQVPKMSNCVENSQSPQSDNKNNYKPIRTNSANDDNITKNKEASKSPEIDYKDTTNDVKPDVDILLPETIMPIPEGVGYNDEQKELNIVKKDVKSETYSENHNGNQNGDTEAAMTVKLPTKKSAAKTETKVEISKKTLPDGSIEEVKKTITKTTIDGKTEIKTKTQTTIIPKNDPEDEEEEVEEEEEEESGDVVVQELGDQEKTVEEKTQNSVQENGQQNVIKTEERSETTTTSTKKVVVVQDDKENEAEEEVLEEAEAEEVEPVTVVIKKVLTSEEPKITEEDTQNEENVEVEKENEEVEDENMEVEEENVEVDEENQLKKEETEKVEDINQKTKSDEREEETIKVVENAAPKDEETEDVEEEEEYEEAEEKEVEIKEEVKKEPEDAKVENNEEDEASEYEEECVEPEKKEVTEKPIEETKPPVEDPKASVVESVASTVEIEIPIQRESDPDEKQEVIVKKQEELKQLVIEETLTPKTENLGTLPEAKVPLREPSVPLEKVEDVEIKPIGAGNFVTKSHTETTEIITGTSDKPTGILTEYNRTENIVTVNRSTKTLDYENAQQTIPTLTYFTPHIEKFPPAPQPSRPYQPVYPSEPTSERRHSLLLERLSMERQIPTSEIYQSTQQYNPSVEQQKQWSDEPRVEILTIENVKPSSITNQQWYQQTRKDDVAYNNVAPVAPSWTQPKPVYNPPPQQQPTYQPPQQPAYQAPQPVYQPPTQPQPVYQPQPQYHSQPVQPQSQYQSYTETEHSRQNSSSQQNTYSTYTPKPTNWPPNSNSNMDPPIINTPSQYGYKDTTNSYQTQRTSSYVPPPWEQDSNYVVDNSQNYYQPQQQPNVPDLNQSWKPAPPANKFTKTTPTAYIPPKPNQSFVKHVTIAEPPKQPGRKTYYSEYERRYISVPESTYIPGETKLQQNQHQPDPSPAYYYDNNEPTETVEHQWRKELREFTEKAQTQPAENVKPPWEMESKTQYAKTQETYTATPTPTWSQTLRPQSWRERSFESEFTSQEWPKTNTLGRGRPLSSYGKETIPERTRGVSVDRYNPNNYQAPVAAQHPPVQTFTHNPPAPHATGYHNPNVPAYHARASAEPREQTVYQQPRACREARASPFQSRSFKYLQWITGTEDL